MTDDVILSIERETVKTQINSMYNMHKWLWEDMAKVYKLVGCSTIDLQSTKEVAVQNVPGIE